MLKRWLQEDAGVKGKSLEKALSVCEEHDIEEVADLRDMLDMGHLKEAGFSLPTLSKIKKVLAAPGSPGAGAGAGAGGGGAPNPAGS